MKLKNLILPIILLVAASSVQAAPNKDNGRKPMVKMVKIKNTTGKPIKARVVFNFRAEKNDIDPKSKEVQGDVKTTVDIQPGDTATFDATKAKPIKGSDKDQMLIKRLVGLKDISVSKIVAGGASKDFSKNKKGGTHHNRFEVGTEKTASGKTSTILSKVMDNGSLKKVE